MSENSNGSKKNIRAFQYHQENIIELTILLDMLKKEWKIIACILLFFTIGSIIYSNTLPKHYQAKTILLPPSMSSINSLNIKDYYKVTGDDLYFSLLENLRSRKLQKEFFTNNKTFLGDKYVPSLEIFYDNGKAGETRFITVVISGTDPGQIATLVNDYVEFVDDRTIASMQDAIKTQLLVDKNNVASKISSLREVAEKQKEDTIIRIIEDLDVAQQLNMVNPAKISINNYTQTIDGDPFSSKIHAGTPGYLKGTEILKAELNAIKSRKNNDPYIQGLDMLLAEREYLDNVLKSNIENVHSARIDEIAVPPAKPYKPRSFFIIATGISFGVLLSIFFTLIRVMHEKKRNIREAEK
jgi:chain length determinant protein (polysaccharide antigen chain regulator)